jgi:hypothetical protein
LFPEDFFGTQNQYTTIQNHKSKNKEHPRIIIPTLLKTNRTRQIFAEIKEEKCEESSELTKNKTSLKIFIPYDNSIGDISTNGESYNTPMTPMTPVIQAMQTEPNKNYGKKGKMKDRLMSNNIPSSPKENLENNHIKDTQIDLSVPMAFTFNAKFKDNQSKTVANNKINRINRINKFSKREISSKDSKNKNKNKTLENKSERNYNQRKYTPRERIKSNDIRNRKTINNKSSSYIKNNNKQIEVEQKRNTVENYSQREIKRYSRNNYNLSYNERKAKSAKRNKAINNIKIVKNINNGYNPLIKKNDSNNKKDLNNKSNSRCSISEYRYKKKDLEVNSRVEKEINNVFKKLPDDNEKKTELNNKFQLFVKKRVDIKDVKNKKKSQNLFLKKK